MNFSLTDYEKFSIEKLAFEDQLSSRKIAEMVFGSKSKKTRVQQYINHVRAVRSSKTYLLTQQDVEHIANSDSPTSELAEYHNVPELLVRRIRSGAVTHGLIREEPEYYQRLVKRAQKQADLLRVERKQTRESSRVNNMLEELTGAILDVMSDHSFTIHTKSHKSSKTKAVGIVHLSDLHFNEQIDLPHNKFNFDIASKRIKKHIMRAKHYFGAHGITDVVVCITGDTQNSDRRLEEVLTNAANRSKALFLAIDILQQAICDLNELFNVSVFSVTGNESRVGKDVGWVNAIAQDNYDFILHNGLAMLFRDKPGVSFGECYSSPLEKVINVLGSNILLIHGHNGLASNPSTKVAQKRAQYAARGIRIDYVIFGHIHEALIADTYARSSGLPGANAYSENALNLTSRASQNLYIFYDDRSHDCIKVDLQNVDDVDGYPYEKALESYHSTEEIKGRDETVIVKVVI